MGAWAFQGVLNVGIQIVLIVFSGWCFARFRLVAGDQFMGQINVLLLRVAFPTLNIYLLGIKVDLRDADAWRSLGGYMLWVTLVQVGILVYVWLCKGRTIGDAGLFNLVLTANNTVIVGLPVMEATFPNMGSRLSMLTAFVLFFQVIPFSITAFEVEKWIEEDRRRRAQAAEMVSEPPSTPDRELSGRWVAEDLPPPSSSSTCGGDGDGNGNIMEGCNVGGNYSGSAGGGRVAAATATAAEPSTPWSSADGTGAQKHGGGGGTAVTGRTHRRHSLNRSSGGSSTAGREKLSLIHGRLGRRRVGTGVVVGAIARGWAPSTPLDSPTASPEVSTRLKPTENLQAVLAPTPPPPPPPPPLPSSVSDAAIGPNLPIHREATLRPGTGYSFGERGCPSGKYAGISISGLDLCQGLVSPTPGSVALAYLDRAASAPCPNGGIRGDCDGEEARTSGGSRNSNCGEGDGGSDGLQLGTSSVPEPNLVDSPSAAPSRCSSSVSTSAPRAASANHLASAFAFCPHPVSAAVGSSCSMATAPSLVSPSVTQLSHIPPGVLMAAGTAPELELPSMPSVPAVETCAAAGGMAQYRQPPTPAAGCEGRPRQRCTRLANGRASADGPGGASLRTGTVKGPAAHRLNGTRGGDVDIVDVAANEAGIQRRSLPAHWPPGLTMADGGVATARAATTAWDVYGSPGAPPTHRLLSPVALACPDLPVPQAIDLARSMTSVSTEARVSQNGNGPSRMVYENLVLPGNGGDDCSTRTSAMRQLPPAAVVMSGPTAAISLSVVAVDATETAPEDVAPPPPPLQLPDRVLARAAADGMSRRHDGFMLALGQWFKMRVKQYSRVWSITVVILKNPLMWSLLVALVINLSGLRSLLWPRSSHYRPELGWVAGALSWTSGITVPVSLFSNGVWLYGKTFGRATIVQAGGLLFLKLVLLAPLQLACAAACGLEAAAAMSLLLLSMCPVASTSFVIASQYGHGADIVTATTMLGIVLLVPAVLVALALPRAFGLYSYQVAPASS